MWKYLDRFFSVYSDGLMVVLMLGFISLPSLAIWGIADFMLESFGRGPGLGWLLGCAAYPYFLGCMGPVLFKTLGNRNR